MRLLIALAFAGCTIGAPPPEVPPRPPPDPDRMPPAVLARQDPAADTSHNPELSRSSADDHGVIARLLSLLFPIRCNASGSGDAGGLVVLCAVAIVLRRRNKSSRIGNAPET